MATAPAVSSESDEDFHSVAGEQDVQDVQPQDDGVEALTPPEHPLKSMQGPFEESIVESNLDIPRPTSNANAEARRRRLLDSQRFDDSWTTRWKQRANAQYHPLLKLMAQITFGMHLLQQNQAKSDQEVVKILQNHVDEVDNFLEQTSEDFDLAIRDIDERIRFLQLPMQHVKVFSIMLDDKQFRTQLLDGNDKIERIIDRTARAMNAALLDVQKGRQATRELSKYLNSVQYTWPSERADLEAIYSAMRGNEEGWKKCYKDLQAKGNHLGNKLIELGTIIGEMSKMAAAASRRVGPGHRPRSSGNSSVASSTVLRSRFNPDARLSNVSAPAKDKPLPRAPSTTSGVESMPAKARPASFHQRFEKPREVPVPATARVDNERPRTSGGIVEKSTALRRDSGPLSSHPPEGVRPRSAGNDRANGTIRSKSAPRDTTSRSVSQPLTDGKATHARAASAAVPTTRNRDSFMRDAIAGSSFARRWSIRKKHPGPTPEDYVEPAQTRGRREAPKSSASSLKSNSQLRLATVQEGSGKAGEEEEAAEPTAGPINTPSANNSVTALPVEPKSRVVSTRNGKSATRQSILANVTNAESNSKTTAPSIASSIKRRTMSIRAIFGKRPKAEVVSHD